MDAELLNCYVCLRNRSKVERGDVVDSREKRASMEVSGVPAIHNSQFLLRALRP